MVQHTHPASLVLVVAVIVLGVAARGAFCGWLCPFGALQQWLHGAAQAVADRVPPLRRVRRAITVRSNGRAWRGDRPGAADGPLGGLSPGRSSGSSYRRHGDPRGRSLVRVAVDRGVRAELGVRRARGHRRPRLFVERPFCRYAWPLGAVQAIVGKASPIAIQRDAATCTGCDLCTRACPMAIPVHTRTRVTDSACIGCLECVAACPSAPGLTVTVALPLPQQAPAALVAEPRPVPSPRSEGRLS